MLENANVRQMIELLLPSIFTSAVFQIIEKGKVVRNLLNENLLIASVCRANQSGLQEDYMEALKHIRAAEVLLARYSSLSDKLCAGESNNSEEYNLSKFIISLIEDATSKSYAGSLEGIDHNVISRGVPIFGASDSPIGNAVRSMLERYNVPGGRMPPPTRRQYILRWSVPRSSVNSRVVPQRLFASIEQDEFRLCGSFLEDTVYT
ncbi:hypothetical protein DICVIV_09222 [Dictyocaulus viviparus]|uniref:Rab3GAP catalytic subunit C-terminal domain-containing protein n=1 Tax=Dictyocaulus viviparus TaxID=29172 RepID=A0A0D8XJN4_DICVI|nr:hypothetical protein DICVIV_09222 [Dictyocaulus viviparus]